MTRQIATRFGKFGSSWTDQISEPNQRESQRVCPCPRCPLQVCGRLRASIADYIPIPKTTATNATSATTATTATNYASPVLLIPKTTATTVISVISVINYASPVTFGSQVIQRFYINQSKPVRKFVKHPCAEFLAPTNFDCTSVCTILNKENRFQMINQNRCRI